MFESFLHFIVVVDANEDAVPGGDIAIDMAVQVLLVFSILEAFVIVLEQLDVTIMLLRHAEGEDLHPEQHVDIDDLIVCQLDGAQ